MKNISHLILLLILVFTMSLFSCQKEHKKMTVILSVDVGGTLTGEPTVSYRNEYGEVQTDSLNGDWGKAFVTDFRKPFDGSPFFLEVVGVLKGSIMLKIKTFTCDRDSEEGSHGTDVGASARQVSVRCSLSD